MHSDRPPNGNTPKRRKFPQLAAMKARRAAGNGPAPFSPRPTGRTPRSTVSEDFERFVRGDLSEAEYIEARIERATLHLRGRVSGRKLERIRAIVSETCASDPVFLAMKQRLLRRR